MAALPHPAARRIGDAVLRLCPISPLKQAALAHLVLAPEQEQFAGDLDVVFDQMRNSRHPQLEHAFAIVAGDAIVGFFVLREKAASPEWATRKAITMHSFRVGLAFQGMGYGKAGIELAIRWTKLNRPCIKQLMLAVNERNTTARAVYLGCGFIDTGMTCHGPIGQQNILTYRL